MGQFSVEIFSQPGSGLGGNQQAGQLTGAKAVDCNGWYSRADATRLIADRGELAEADRHPDPVAEALRWRAYEGELIQIIGRGRGVMRTADRPLEVLVMTDAPLPLPVARAIPAAELQVGPFERMLLEAGIALENAGHAFKCFPNMWPTFAAAKKAAERGKLATVPY